MLGDEALITKYRLWLKEINQEERELLQKLRYIKKEKRNLITWIIELQRKEGE